MANKASKKHPVLFHVDMNSFYASVELLYRPELRGKPVAIAGNPKERRGIVVTSSYEARAYGVKTTMPVWEARRKCPDLIIIPPNFDRYREMSQLMFAKLTEFTPLVEPVSIDEGYMDVTDEALTNDALNLANLVQQAVFGELGLPCSIGVAPNKFLAKMASDMEKPNGLTVLRKRDIQEKLWPLPLIEMHGVGAKTNERLNRAGLKTIGDLAEADALWLKAEFGIKGEKMYERAHGIDERQVDPEAAGDRKSVGRSTTLRENTNDDAELLRQLERLSELVAVRLKHHHLCSNNIQLMLRNRNHETMTRSQTSVNPKMEADDIFEAAKALFLKYYDGEDIRLVGVTALDVYSRDEAFHQLDLFRYAEEVAKAERKREE
ncbi:DNA polymerase-4 [Salsuginibacillus halophilus]|uniref:DNA polymerase IV n=1 Tax=Salsuginibacillus halophilus TaxID=517424 RepID=A0A2P8HY15_9BACI|nr:DNA polymerase IV [Salsuginibacillus halophilus]PSL51119.1 DNA polymerase-4 [Salsuginibacillus halophilus]